MKENIQVCTCCVMDTSDADITFNASGVCHYCIEAEELLKSVKFSPEQEKENLLAIANEIKSVKKGKYDSIIGLSGGVDSSYVAYLAREMGLNPLAVHFDNGWNSDTAVSNIKKIVESCGFDLETYVINWFEFKDLQRSYFKAGVIDIEALTDHAITATMFKLRRQYGIKYVLSGMNIATEYGLPKSWVWNKHDLTNIKAIQKKYGTIAIKDFPTMTSIQKALAKKFGLGGIYMEPLNKINYSKDEAMEVLKKEFNWEYYGEKHYESIFTKFYQAYVLPTKFGVDKRKVHLSAQIRNGEISIAEALKLLEKPLYDETTLKIDKEFVLKKLGFTEKEFDEMMLQKPVPHDVFPTDSNNGLSAIFIKLYKRIFK